MAQTVQQLAKQAGVTEEEVAKQTAVDPTQRADVIVGGAIEARRAGQAAVAEAKAEPLPPVQSSEPARADSDKTRVAIADAGDVSTIATSAHEKAIDVLTARADQLTADRKQALADIEKQGVVSKADLETGQRKELGATRMGLARIGGFLGQSGSGIAHINSLQGAHRTADSRLDLQIAAAKQAAKAAYDDKSFSNARALLDEAAGFEEQQRENRRLFFEETEQVMKLEQFSRDTDVASMSAWVQSGVQEEDVPAKLFDQFDRTSGYEIGTSLAQFRVIQQEKDLATIVNAEDRVKAEIALAGSFADVLAKYDDGTLVKIGDTLHFGTRKPDRKSYVEIGADGNGIGIEFNESTGAWNRTNLGYIGNAKEIIYDADRNPFSWDGEVLRPAFPPSTQINDIVEEGTQLLSDAFTYPDGSPMPYQCGEWVNSLTGSTVGSTADEKISRIDKSLTVENVQVGNTIVLTGSGFGSTGHVGVLVDKIKNPISGKVTHYRVTEANKTGPGVISHNGLYAIDDPAIEGFQPTKMLPEFDRGSDSPWVSETDKKAREAKVEEVDPESIRVRVAKADNVISTIDEAIPMVGFSTSGVTGQIGSKVGGTKAFDLNSKIDTIKANIGFQELQAMRDASPTGGALGQVSEREINFLQSAVASLNIGQSEQQLRDNLQKVRNHYENWKKAVLGEVPEGMEDQVELAPTIERGGVTYRLADDNKYYAE